MASVAPALIDAMVTQATATLTTVRVYDGFGISEDPSDFLMVGVDDPDPESAGLTASADQEQIGMGPAATNYRESGTFTLAAYSFNGDALQKPARDAVYAIRDAVDNLIRNSVVAGPSPSVLGVAGVTKAVTTSWALQQNVWQTNDALLVFSVRFEATI